MGLAHGADGSIDPAEAQAIGVMLREHQPNKDPALIDHIIREATLTYSQDMEGAVGRAVDALKKLPESQRIALLKDLTRLAQADQRIEKGEQVFVHDIAEQWGLMVE